MEFLEYEVSRQDLGVHRVIPARDLTISRLHKNFLEMGRELGLHTRQNLFIPVWESEREEVVLQSRISGYVMPNQESYDSFRNYHMEPDAQVFRFRMPQQRRP